MKKLLIAASIAALTSTANAALHDRGNGLIYDDVLDITWLQDANYAKTSGYHYSGSLTSDQAKSWVSSLTYAGFNDWRLPKANLNTPPNFSSSVDGTTDYGWNNTRSELGYMYYINLKSIGKYNTSGSVNHNYDAGVGGSLNTSYTDDNVTIQFLNLDPNFYFTDGKTADANVVFVAGRQVLYAKSGKALVWAVRDGDVASEVPLPAAAWLFGSALVGLVGLRRKK